MTRELDTEFHLNWSKAKYFLILIEVREASFSSSVNLI